MAPINKIISIAAILMVTGTGLAAPAHVDRRQIGGEATAAYGIINNVDNGSGYMLENLEDGVANGMKPGSAPNEEYGQWGDGASAPAGPPSKRHVRRQGNKIGNGLGPVIEDLGQQGVGEATQNLADQEDGTLTEGVGDLGTTTGDIEEGTLSEAGYGAGQIAESLIQEGEGAKGGAPAAGAPAGAPAGAGGL